MTKLSVVSSWLSSIACGVCLVLAVLATPGVAKADPDCSCCGTDPGPGDYQGHLAWQNCVYQCMQTGVCDESAFFSCTRQMSNCPNWNCLTYDYCVKYTGNTYCSCTD